MPHVSKHEQVVRQGIHSSQDRDRQSLETIPRDDLRGPAAGDQNKGPAGSDHNDSRSTKLKSRMTEKSKARTPVR
jgi:hypothetical protein